MASYIISGPEDDSGIPHESLGKLLLDAINKHPSDELAVIDAKSGESLTFEQLSQQSQSLAASLRHLNVKRDDVIGIASENSCKALVVYLASLFLAAPLHLLHPKFTEYEFKHFLNMTQPRVVMYTNKSKDNLLKIKAELKLIQDTIYLDDDDIGSDNLFYSTLINKSQSFKIEENIDIGKQTAVICNSSGTTGLPKGVMLSHESLRFHLIRTRKSEFFHLDAKDVIPIVVPFYHVYGLNLLNSCLYLGTTLTIWDQFDPKIFLQTIQNYKVKRLYLVPTLTNFLLENPLVEKYNLSSVEEIYSGSTPFDRDDITILRKRFSLKKFHIAYGLTETAGIVLHGWNISNGSCGKLLSGYQLKIVDLKSRQSLPVKKQGEICLKGHVMIGYFNDVQKTNESFDSEGFLHTGDFGYYDEDGYVYVIGRIKEIMKYKSFQVSPVELETILGKHPGVMDVAVVGKPDRRFGELPTALVVKKYGATVTAQEICDHLAQYVSDEKRLHGGVKFVEAIPRTALGKIQRHKLLKLSE